MKGKEVLGKSTGLGIQSLATLIVELWKVKTKLVVVVARLFLYYVQVHSNLWYTSLSSKFSSFLHHRNLSCPFLPLHLFP